MSKNGRMITEKGQRCWQDNQTGKIYKGLMHIRCLGEYDSFIFEGKKSQLPFIKRAGKDEFIDTGLDVLEAMPYDGQEKLFLCQEEEGCRIRFYILVIFEDGKYAITTPRPTKQLIYKEVMPSVLEDLKNGIFEKYNRKILSRGEI